MTPANFAIFPGSMGLALKGMAMARPYDLYPGQIIYRFIDITRSPSPQRAADGAWWLEFEGFQQIKHFAQQHGYSFEYAAHLHTAVLYEWSEVTGYVRAMVLEPLQAWKGRGKQVESTGKDRRDLPKMTPMQSVNEVYQLHIPGLGGNSQLFVTALRFLDYLPV